MFCDVAVDMFHTYVHINFPFFYRHSTFADDEEQKNEYGHHTTITDCYG